MFLFQNHYHCLQFQNNYINLHKVPSGPQSILAAAHTAPRGWRKQNLLCQAQRTKTSTSMPGADLRCFKTISHTFSTNLQNFSCSPTHWDHYHRSDRCGFIIQDMVTHDRKLLRDWQSKSKLILKVMRKRKIPPYLHTGSLEESSILFLSHFPRSAVHNTEIGEEQNVSTLL